MTPADTAVDAAARERPGLVPAEILDRARAILPWIVDIRRDLHQHPELGLEEHRTAERVTTILDELGIENRPIAGTGVLGTISGEASGPAVALRADLDALPLQDAKDVPYRSQIPGRMHACGHDVHTAILLGAARLLCEHGKRPHPVKLFFQPAEETVGGAKLLIAEGALEDPPVRAVFGLHVEPDLEVGRFGLHYGQRNASSDSIRLIVNGASCHGAYPSSGVDAIVIAAHVITAVQSIVSRNVDARDSAVISLGTIQGGTQANIVASRVEIVGTVRTLAPPIRERVLARLRETAEGVASALGGRVELEIEPGYDPLINDDDAIEQVRVNASLLVGEENIFVYPRSNMGVEDFGYYTQQVPGAFFSLGVRNEAKGIVHPIHQERFDVDEECLAYGAAIQVMNALSG